MQYGMLKFRSIKKEGDEMLRNSSLRILISYAVIKFRAIIFKQGQIREAKTQFEPQTICNN
jgi:hypothetical protein